MKNRIMQLFLLLGLVFGVSSLARATSPYHLNVPFDFTVNGKLMKAGNYEIQFGIAASSAGSFLIRSADGKNAALVTPAATRQFPKEMKDINVVFEKSGDAYSLSEVYSPRISVELAKKDSVNVARVELHSAI